MVSTNDGRVFQFRVYLPHAGAVELVGDFTRWCDDGIPLRRSPAGWWEGDVPITPGEHRFSYLVDGRHWMPDYAASGLERDDAGNLVSALVVRADEPAPAA
jgi:1,4-alpha-glucan branching enzyme